MCSNIVHVHTPSTITAGNKLVRKTGCIEDTVYTFVAALKQCSKRGDLATGKALHLAAIQAGCHTNKYVANALVTMYSKCRSMREARAVFEVVVHRDVVVWTSLILGYVGNGEGLIALDLFISMDCEPDSFTFVAVLNATAGLATQDRHFCLEKGMAIHRQARERGLHTHLYVENALIDMYSNCRAMLYAQDVFESMTHRDVVSWTSLALGYVENGQSLLAMDLLKGMDCKPNAITFVAALKACIGLVSENQSDRKSCLEKGMSIHRRIKKEGFHADAFVENNLMGMYSKCRSMQDARVIFDNMVHRDVVSWNIILMGYVENGESLVVMDLFSSMDSEPNYITVSALLKACTCLDLDRHCIELGMAIHSLAKERGFDTHVFVQNSLVDMYIKCGSVSLARDVFEKMMHRDVVAWTSLILAYVENGESSLGMDLLMRMDCVPNSLTYYAAFRTCTDLATQKQADKQFCLETGMAIHRQAKEHGFCEDTLVATSLIEMYSKCRSIQDARTVFDTMMFTDVVSWTNLIQGYVENGESLVAIELFGSMEYEPDSVAFVAVLKACCNIGSLAVGRTIHAQVCKLGLEDILVTTTLVDLYGKGSNMAIAEQVFNILHSWSVVSCNALISGYTSLGDTYQVFSFVYIMQEYGLHMDSITFSLILTACSHSGTVGQGIRYFESMYRYGIIPNVEHYTCMVDMLGRANRLQDALSFAKNMPYDGESAVWRALLGACKNWSNLEIGKVAFDKLVSCNKIDGAAYVLMGDMYKNQA